MEIPSENPPEDPYALTPAEQRADDNLGGVNVLYESPEVTAPITRRPVASIARRRPSSPSNTHRPETAPYEPIPEDVRLAALAGLRRVREEQGRPRRSA
jgi:hypothetical protein